jgi:Tfp pilus assembly protein PilZ
VKEQRRHPRVLSHQRCWCEAEDITRYAQIENLSEGGLFLRASGPLGRGAQVRLRLGSGSDEVCAAAAVVWRRGDGASDEEPGMGLHFQALDRQAAIALRGHMSRLMRSGA